MQFGVPHQESCVCHWPSDAPRAFFIVEHHVTVLQEQIIIFRSSYMEGNRNLTSTLFFAFSFPHFYATLPNNVHFGCHGQCTVFTVPYSYYSYIQRFGRHGQCTVSALACGATGNALYARSHTLITHTSNLALQKLFNVSKTLPSGDPTLSSPHIWVG